MAVKVKEAVKKALKEAGRVVLLAVLPVLTLAVEAGKIDLKAIGLVGLVALLRFVDKLLHEKAKAVVKKDRNEGYLGVKGLTGF